MNVLTLIHHHDEKKDEANVKDFFRKQILFYQRELKNKQKVIESLLLLLHENCKIITRDEQKSPSQEFSTFVKNGIATQTNETIISTMQDDSNRLNFSGIELLNKTQIDNRCIDEQFTFIRQLQKSKTTLKTSHQQLAKTMKFQIRIDNGSVKYSTKTT